MTAPQEDREDLATEEWQRREEIVQRFEAAWKAGQRPAIDEFVPADGSERQAVLPELVHVDLEFRLKAGEPARAEEYLKRYPELCDRTKAVLDLIAAEFRHCRARNADVSIAEYRERFPQVEGLVERLEAEIAAQETLTLQLSPEAAIAGATTEDGSRVAATPVSPAIASVSLREQFPFLKPPQEPDEIGRLGNYRILKVLGQGGMGVVFQAEDILLRRQLAVKVIKPEISARPEVKERFLREARAAAAVQHDHVVGIFHVGEDAGVLNIAMPFLQGQSLETRLVPKTCLPVAEVLRIGRETAEGLSAAHQRGLVHRDIKPSNLWLEGKQGRVKILDFGLARHVEDTGRLTGIGEVLGTPAYMSPEQVDGKTIDARADLFSLGVVLYEASTGVNPFAKAGNIATLGAVAFENPRPPRELNPAIPRGLSRLILALLEKDPAKRPASAEVVAGKLADLERSPGASARIGDESTTLSDSFHTAEVRQEGASGGRAQTKTHTGLGKVLAETLPSQSPSSGTAKKALTA